jgi:hypothetical protein
MMDQLQTCCESNTWSATKLNCFEGRSPMTFMVSVRVENGVPQGQNLKLKELCRVVPQMKTLDEHIIDQLKFRRYDVVADAFQDYYHRPRIV